MKLIRVDFHSMRHMVFAQMIADVAYYFDRLKDEPNSVKNAMRDLQAGLVDVRANIAFRQASHVTIQMEKQDRARCSIFQGIRAMIRSFERAYRDDEGLADDAAWLNVAFDHFRHINERNYEEKSAAFESLLRTLEAPENAERLARLDLTGAVERLRAANGVFIEMILHRVDERAQRPDVPMKEARDKATRAFRQLIERVEARLRLVEEDEATGLREFATEYNAVASHYARSLAIGRGKARAQAEREKEEEGVQLLLQAATGGETGE